MSTTSLPVLDLVESDVMSDRDAFLRHLLGELAAVLQEVVGLEEASGMVSLVGLRMGERIDREYRQAMGVGELTREQTAAVLVDLKKRIHGDFSIVEETEDCIVLENHACPFGDQVRDRPALCMMTSNVFGTVVAGNLGYARVEIVEAFARGHSRCLVLVHLQRPSEGDPGPGREFFAP